MADNRIIARNTAYLYVRMLFIMVVTLFTSRVVLRVLGVDDYGIQNLVGGIVAAFGFIQGTVSAAASRFFAFEIGRNDIQRLNRFFRISFECFTVVALIILILCETAGIWFLDNKLLIPAERLQAAHTVFRFAIYSFMVQTLSQPFFSMIIAKEKMKVYAYVGVMDAVLKLAIVYCLTLLPFDKLETYAVLLFAVQCLSNLVYVIYCAVKLREETSFGWFWDGKMFREMFSFSFWILFGALSSVCNGQGLNMLLGMFFLPGVNAARGIAYQVDGAINQFGSNFYTAFRPQITKLYAEGKMREMMDLVLSSARIACYLILIVGLPVFFEAPYLMTLWLKTLPQYSVEFTRIVILITVVNTISYPFQAAVGATGTIRNYQIVTAGILILVLPAAYVVLKLGAGPQSVMWVALAGAVLAQISRTVFMKKLVGMSIKEYMLRSVLPIMKVAAVSSAVPLVLHFTLPYGWVRCLATVVLSIVVTALSVYLLGIEESEKEFVKSFVRRIAKS